MKYLTEIVLMMILSFAAGALCFLGVHNDSWATVIAAIGSLMVTGWVIVDKALDDLKDAKNQTHTK